VSGWDGGVNGREAEWGGLCAPFVNNGVVSDDFCRKMEVFRRVATRKFFIIRGLSGCTEE